MHDFIKKVRMELLNVATSFSNITVELNSIDLDKLINKKTLPNTSELKTSDQNKNILKFIKSDKQETGKMSLDAKENKIIKGDDLKMQKGSITLRKDGRWMGRYYENGKQKCVYSRDKRECIRKLKEAIIEYENSTKEQIIGKNMTLNTWFDYWIKMYKEGILKESSLVIIKNSYNLNIKNTLGKMKIGQIKPNIVADFLDNLSSDNRKKQSYSILNEMFDMLKKHGYVKINNVELVPLKLNKQETKEIKAKSEEKTIITYEEEATLLEYIKTKKRGKVARDIYDIIVLMVNSGLRIGEVLALEVQDIDFTNKEINVYESYSNTTKTVGTTKTSSSVRIAPLLPPVEEMLIKRINLNKITGLIFEGVSYNTVTKYIINFSKECGINASSHTLRHTFATRCREKGVDPKVVQEWLGHASYQTTIDTYTHITDDKMQKETNKLLD